MDRVSHPVNRSSAVSRNVFILFLSIVVPNTTSKQPYTEVVGYWDDEISLFAETLVQAFVSLCSCNVSQLVVGVMLSATIRAEIKIRGSSATIVFNTFSHTMLNHFPLFFEGELVI